MESMPLVGAEVRRVGAAFDTASTELDAATTTLTDLPADTVGTPECDDAVTDMLRELTALVSRLESTASACAYATRRVDVAADDGGPE